MSFDTMVKVVDILKPHMKPASYFDSDHDIIYIPWFEQEGEVAEQLKAAGCHWEDSASSWASF